MAMQKTLIHLVLCASFLSSSLAYQFNVGGRDGWVLNPSENYNHWAERMRFQVNDALFFKYKKGSDAVLVVNKDDYEKCNTYKPIMKLEDGNSIFKFDRSGPFFFISGNKANCQNGQKLIIVVLAIRHQPNPTPLLPPVTPSPTASPPKGYTPISPSPGATPESPTPAASAPKGFTPISPSPAQTPGSPSPAASAPKGFNPISPSPAQTPGSPAPAASAPKGFTPISPSPAVTPVSPSPEAKSPAPSMSPSSPSPVNNSPSKSPTSAVSPSPAPATTSISPSSSPPSPTIPLSPESSTPGSTAPAPSGTPADTNTPGGSANVSWAVRAFIPSVSASTISLVVTAALGVLF